MTGNIMKIEATTFTNATIDADETQYPEHAFVTVDADPMAESHGDKSHLCIPLSEAEKFHVGQRVRVVIEAL
jgi:hypothetical protein